MLIPRVCAHSRVLESRVAIEMGGTPLEEFEHPDRAIYLLGSEDTGLPKSVVHACHQHVALPAERYESYNVAMAGWHTAPILTFGELFGLPICLCCAGYSHSNSALTAVFVTR